MNLDELIEDNDIKITPARKEILEILVNATKPICYDEIKESLSMDKATFYRNITKFEENKILNSFESNDKKRYYELSKAPHAHFVCNICNKIECIENEIKIELKSYLIEDVIIKGKCPACI
jgi:Fur family ferric uptake transcriptional regulator